MTHQNTSYSPMNPSDEISIACNETKHSAMYSVAKYSDDDDVIAAFVHNKNKQSPKYGHCFTVTKDGQVFSEDFNSGELVEVSLLEAFFRISDSPMSAHQLLSETLKNIVLEFNKTTESKLNKEFSDKDFYTTLNHTKPNHPINRITEENEIINGVFAAKTKNTFGIAYQVEIQNDDPDCLAESFPHTINPRNSNIYEKFQGILIYSDFDDLTLSNGEGGLTLHAFAPMLANPNESEIEQLLSNRCYVDSCAAELKSLLERILITYKSD